MVEKRFNAGECIISGKSLNEPEKVQFTNSSEAAKMYFDALERTKKLNTKIMVHADVDFDGAASAYITYKVTESIIGVHNLAMCINNKREHGITDKYVELINKLNADKKIVELLIVVDSSTNCMKQLHEINCNVLVIDHHELEVPVENMIGDTAGGKYIIVNNEIDGIADMSGAQVVYEWFRYIGFEQLLMTQKLYSWVAVSLFSDVINGDNERNQWYIQKTIEQNNWEDTLNKMFKAIYKESTGNKSDIQFRLVPLFNAAIRTGHSTELLTLVLREPQCLWKMLEYKNKQATLVDKAVSEDMINVRMLEYSDIIMYNMTDIMEMEGYEGLIASKLMNKYRKTCIVYRDTEYGIKGSFRLTGRYAKCNLRLALNELEGIKASGHSDAFGFEVHGEDGADVIRSAVVSIADKAGITEDSNMHKNNLREAEDVIEKDGHIYIEVYTEAGMKKLIKNYELGIMATINSRMSGNKKAMIKVPNVSENVRVISTDGKKTVLNVLGVETIMFEEYRENYGYIWLYPEINRYLTVYVDGVRL